MKNKFLAILLTVLLFNGCNSGNNKNQVQQEEINVLTEAEKEEGWKLLFDGETFTGWRGLGMDTIPANWIIENGCIKNISKAEIDSISGKEKPPTGDLMSKQKFENFEIFFEWKINKSGNSGIKYNVSEEMSNQFGVGYTAVGFEYQLLDDDDVAYANLHPSQFTGSLYDLFPSQNTQLKPVGVFNNSRIVVNGNHGEHWLNGKKVVEYEFNSAALDSAYQKSKFHDFPGFSKKRAGHIVLQNHSDDVWFRNIKIHDLTDELEN